MSQYLLSDEEEPKSWVIPLVFAMITIPFLMAGCEEKKHDCYRTSDDCGQDWSTSDCKPNPDKSCPYIGRSYTGSHIYRGGLSKSPQSIGIKRGGFGFTGRGFFRGG